MKTTKKTAKIDLRKEQRKIQKILDKVIGSKKLVKAKRKSGKEKSA